MFALLADKYFQLKKKKLSLLIALFLVQTTYLISFRQLRGR